MAFESKFRNGGKGVVGAVKIGIDGKPQGVPVSPGEFVWLTEEEQVLTANAPRNESDNPFVNGSLILEIRGSEMNTARPIGDDQEVGATEPESLPDPGADPSGGEEIEELKPAGVGDGVDEEETGAIEPPSDPAPEGQRAQNEELAEEKKAAPAPSQPAAKPPVAPKPKVLAE